VQKLRLSIIEKDANNKKLIHYQQRIYLGTEKDMASLKSIQVHFGQIHHQTERLATS
jgi:hypothetical protein